MTDFVPRIAFVCEGDAESSDKAFSGIAKSLVDHLRLEGHSVTCIDVRPPLPVRALTAACTYSRNRGTWRARFRYGAVGYQFRSAYARKGLASLSGKTDVIFQIGANFVPPESHRLPYVLYCDWNMALSIKDRSNAHTTVSPLPLGEAEKINEQQRAIYAGAAFVFTISESLRQSFIEDYELSPNKVVTTYAGSNISPAHFADKEIKEKSHPPTILFIGKEFRRKGGDDLLSAFRVVRSQVPEARLLIAGPQNLNLEEPGVECLGFLRKDVPEEMARLVQAYHEADIFCLPTLHEPFGIVVLESMFFGLPCVTTNTWALPEMVVDGQTGYTVNKNDPAALASRLLRLLGDPILRKEMGAAGRERANQLFTWEAAAHKIHDRLGSLSV